MTARCPAGLALLLVGWAQASLLAQGRPELHVSRAASAPKIDGVLDDPVWLDAPLTLGSWISYDPLRGESAPERTDVRVAYDDRFIFVAFTCRSNDPTRIRTTISRRDSVFSDDWVGLSLDSTGAGQTSYHLMVNPSGVQMDAVNTTAAGERFESDFLWMSAGQRSADGYVVEIALPLPSIRFAGGADVRMGILFWRHVSRAGVSYSWPEMPPGQWVFERHAHLVFPELVSRRLRELLPSVTWPLTQARATPDRWSRADGQPDVGLSLKYGVTSQVTLDATINPDFSQVESDAFQVQVNQRFPIFFSERRPFFMEGMGLFSVAGTGGDYNMRRAVHTRRIVDPAWGIKLTGAADRVSFGVLASADTTPEDVGGWGTTVSGRSKRFAIGRATYALGQSNYVGAIVADTEHAGRYNRATGGDLSWKPTTSQGLTATYLWSQTGVGTGATMSGSAAQVSYRYDTQRVLVATQVEHYDRPFQMDTAFINRTGFTSTFTYSELSFYPKEGNRLGVVRIRPLVLIRAGNDHLQGGQEGFVFTGVAVNTRRRGFFRVQYGHGYERWAGQRFRTGEPLGAFGGVQLFRWLHVGGFFFPRSWATFYDSALPFQGRSAARGFDLTWQPNQHLSQTVSYNGVRFSRADSGAPVYSVDILNLKTVYQFDRRFLVRLLTQFDNSRPQWLTDLLASYEFVPGTALHAGYGALYERRQFEDGRFVENAGPYLTVSRGLFFKASYLYRF